MNLNIIVTNQDWLGNIAIAQSTFSSFLSKRHGDAIALQHFEESSFKTALYIRSASTYHNGITYVRLRAKNND
jgi:hypothetical protein